MRSIRFTGLALAIGLLAAATEAQARSSPPAFDNEVKRDTMVMTIHVAPGFSIAGKVDTVVPEDISTIEGCTRSSSADTSYSFALMTYFHSNHTAARSPSTTSASAHARHSRLILDNFSLARYATDRGGRGFL